MFWGDAADSEANAREALMAKVRGYNEELYLDALTGGFNLQIAWSTGYAAGNAIQ